MIKITEGMVSYRRSITGRGYKACYIDISDFIKAREAIEEVIDNSYLHSLLKQIKQQIKNNS